MVLMNWKSQIDASAQHNSGQINNDAAIAMVSTDIPAKHYILLIGIIVFICIPTANRLFVSASMLTLRPHGSSSCQRFWTPMMDYAAPVLQK